MRRMFEQLGLRFDEDFLNRMFFRGRGISFSFGGPSGYGRTSTDTQGAGNYRQNTSAFKPNWFERLLLKSAAKFGKLMLRFLFGIRYAPPSANTLDHHMDLEISAKEAKEGGEKPVTYKRNNETRKLMVKIPKGIKNGTEIRLKGMGIKQANSAGDLYLRVKIVD